MTVRRGPGAIARCRHARDFDKAQPFVKADGMGLRAKLDAGYARHGAELAHRLAHEGGAEAGAACRFQHANAADLAGVAHAQQAGRSGWHAIDSGEQVDRLIVEIVENPIINQVVFEGNGAVSEDKLREEVTLRPRGIYTRAKVQEDVGSIVELYRLQGRISATVTPKLVQLEQNRVDVIFEINEGPQTGISAINVLGNKAFSDNDVRDVMVTERSQWWKFFSNNDNYDPNRLEYDQEQLRKFYTNRGYYDFRVVSAVAESIAWAASAPPAMALVTPAVAAATSASASLTSTYSWSR